MSRTFKYIGIETTTLCNSKCAVCPRGTKYHHSFGTMSMELFEKIILDIRDNHEVASILRFGGMGDAACDKLLIARLRFMKQKAPSLRFGLSSNMAAWKNAYTDAIADEQLTSHMRFSILAYSDVCSEKVYGYKNQAEKARSAIDYFIKKNEEAGHPISLEVYTLSLEKMEEDVASIKERYWDKVDQFETWKPHSWSNLYPDLRACQEDRRPCVSIERMNQPLIGIHGDVIPCSMDINYSLSCGSMKEMNLEEILSSEKALNLQQLNRDGEIETLPSCKGCVYLNAHPTEVLLDSKTCDHCLDRQHTTDAKK